MNNIIKLSIENGEYSISVTLPEKEFPLMDLGVVMGTLKKGLFVIKGEERAEEVPVMSQPKKIETPRNDEFRIRERIPNNVVDVHTLDVKQAVTEKALVRCPHCGQAHCLAANAGSKIYMMERDFKADDFNIIAEFDSLTSEDFIGVCCKPDTDRLAYFQDLQNAETVNDSDFAVNNDSEIFCPVCCESDTFLNWKKAYETPLEFFETEHLCDVCGGETITKVVKKQKVNKCEKCGYETDYKEE